MALLFPNQTIERRWTGALQARLTRAPLENFLRSHGLKFQLAGTTSCDTDNIARAAIYMVDTGMHLHCDAQGVAHRGIPHAALGQAICAVSHASATLIHEESAWRIAALVGTAKVLSPRIGLTAAAHTAAAAARAFHTALRDSSMDPELREIESQAVIAVQGRGHIADVATCVAQYFAMRQTRGGNSGPSKATAATIAVHR